MYPMLSRCFFDPPESIAETGVGIVVSGKESHGGAALLADTAGGSVGKIVEASGSFQDFLTFFLADPLPGFIIDHIRNSGLRNAAFSGDILGSNRIFLFLAHRGSTFLSQF